MDTSNSTVDKKPKARTLMEMSAHAYNKYLTPEHLAGMRLQELLANVHPQDRVRLETLHEEEEEALKEQIKNTTIKRTKYGES